MADIFISYSSKDFAVADAIRQKFEENGISCWMDKSELRGGADWQENIITGIKSAKVFVLIYSHNAVDSKWVIRELTLADENQLSVIPYNIDGSSVDTKFELILSRIQWIYAEPNLGHYKFDELINVSKNAVCKLSVKNDKVYKVDLHKKEMHEQNRRSSQNSNLMAKDERETISIEVLRSKISEIVNNHLTGWPGRWNFYEQINKKKLSNAVSAYAKGVSESNYVCLFDSTMWGTAKTGIVISTDRICISQLYSKIIINERFIDIDYATLAGNAFIIRRKNGTEISDTIFSGQPKEGSEFIAIISEILDIYNHYKIEHNGIESDPDLATTQESKIRNMIKNKAEQYASKMFNGSVGSVGFNEKISEKALKNALRKFAFGAGIDNVLLLIDTTLGHTGKQGVVFTYDKIYMMALLSNPIVISYDQITTMIPKNGNDIYSSYLIFGLSDSTTVEFQDSFINKEILIDLIQTIKSIKK